MRWVRKFRCLSDPEGSTTNVRERAGDVVTAQMLAHFRGDSP